jgi:hypothetical protein
MPATLEDEILIACSTLHLDEASCRRIILACTRGEVNWELLYCAAVAHKIAPLVYRNLSACGPVHALLPGKVLDEFQKVVRWYALKNAIATSGIAELAGFLESRSHEVLLLKHAALSARSRGLFDVTMSDDVDVVVRPRGESPDGVDERYVWKLRPWMFAGGLREMFARFMYGDSDHTSAVIREFAALDHPWRSVCCLELDNRIHHDVVWGGVIEVDFRMVWRDATEERIEGKPVYLPSPADLLIMSAINVYRKPYPRLRNFAEIHEFGLGRNDFDWDALTRKARAYQCSQLVYSALHATRAVLGSDFPESILKALKPPAVRSRAVAFVNGRVSPTAICRSGLRSGHPSRPRRRLSDVAGRFLAFDNQQLMRFLWFRIILRRVFGAIKW